MSTNNVNSTECSAQKSTAGRPKSLRLNSCEMCTKGTREHNHPERPLASTLFKIKPIACKHRLLRKTPLPQNQQVTATPMITTSTAKKPARKLNAAAAAQPLS